MKHAVVDHLVVGPVAEGGEHRDADRIAEVVDRAVAEDEAGGVEMGAAETIVRIQAERVLLQRLGGVAPAVRIAGRSNVPALEIAERFAVGVQIGAEAFFADQDRVARTVGDIGDLDGAQRETNAGASERVGRKIAAADLRGCSRPSESRKRPRPTTRGPSSNNLPVCRRRWRHSRSFPAGRLGPCSYRAARSPRRCP